MFLALDFLNQFLLGGQVKFVFGGEELIVLLQRRGFDDGRKNPGRTSSHECVPKSLR